MGYDERQTGIRAESKLFGVFPSILTGCHKMLSSEDSPNNKRNTSTTLLEKQLSLINSVSEFSVSDEEIEEALTARFSEMENNAVMYFGGHVEKKGSKLPFR